MVSYRVRRLHSPDDPDRRYHLFDRTDQLLLVADVGSPWLVDGTEVEVRFARPDGLVVATMDLPRPGERRPEKGQNYPVIYEHAVYALITAVNRPPTGATAPLKPPALIPPFAHLVIEVEGNRWLAPCSDEPDGPLLRIYDTHEFGTTTQVDPKSADLPDPIGVVDAGIGDYDFDVTLPAGWLQYPALLGLALVFLLDAAA